MKVKNLVLIALAVVGMTACSGGGSKSEPQKLVESIYSALQKGDYETAAKIELEHSLDYYDEDVSKEMREMAVPYIAGEMRKYAENKQGGGIESFKIDSTSVARDGGYRFYLTVVGKDGDNRKHYLEVGKLDDSPWLIDPDAPDNWREH
jgi:hypothetical protein